MSEAVRLGGPDGRLSPLRGRLTHLAALCFCGVLPAVVVGTLLVEAVVDDAVAFDFRVFYAAAEAILAGDSPYQALDDPSAVVGRGYVYPPLTALLAAPLTILPVEVAGLLVMTLLLAAALAVPWVLGVRDWRCYGLLLLWPPVISAIQTGSVTLVLALGAALAWRFRDRPAPGAIAVGTTLALKAVLWPLAVWLAAANRARTAIWALAAGAGLVLGSWALIGFAGISEYAGVVRRLQRAVEMDAYTLRVVALDAGLPSSLARLVWLAVGVALLAALVVVARRGDERSAFVLAITAGLALTPIVWLHYFALLLVVVAVARPALGAAWFVPLAMVVTPGSGHPTPFETAATLGIAALTVALALHAVRRDARRPPTGSRTPAALPIPEP